MPHHSTLKDNLDTTKFRIAFSASGENEGHSLNDVGIKCHN